MGGIMAYLIDKTLVTYINLIPAGALAAICTWTDIKSMTIYNRYTYPAALIGLIYCIVTAQFAHIYGTALVAAIYLFFFITGKMGGGDLKLAVALSLFLGVDPVLYGSIMAGFLMMFWGFAMTWHRTGKIRNGLLVAFGKLPGGEVPYGAILGPASFLTAVFIRFV